jgi:hypothetical protein
MGKSLKRRTYKKHRKSHTKNRKANAKNIKRVSLKKLHKGHKTRKARHYMRGLHKVQRSYYGGKMRGGMVSSPAAGPVGYSWDGGNISSWPGAQASEGLDTNGQTMSNHFSLSKNGIVVGGIDPARSTSDDQLLKGGKGKKRTKGKKGKKSQKGGFFQEIVNLGRGVENGINGGYFNLMGKTQPISQNPYPQNQPIDNDFKYIGGMPNDNIKNMTSNANKSVTGI